MKKTLSLLICIQIVISISFSVPFVVTSASYSDVDSSELYSTYLYEAEECIEDNPTINESYYQVNAAKTAVKSTASGEALNQGLTSTRIKLDGISKPGAYNIFQRTYYDGTSAEIAGRNVYISVGDRDELTIYTPKMVTIKNNYTWKYLGSVTLYEGEDKIYFYSRDQRVYIDKILVTNDFYFYPREEDYTTQQDTGLTRKFGNAPFPQDKKNVHPRLLFCSNDIETIKLNFKHPQNIAQYESMLKFYKNNYNLKDKTSAYAKEYCNSIFHTIESKAFMYAVYGKEYQSDGEKAIELITTMLDLLFNAENLSHRDRTLHYSVSVAARVYDWCNNLLTKEDKHNIFSKCMRNLSVTEGGFPIKSTPYGEGHQYEEKLLKDALMLAVATYDDYPDLYNHLVGFLLSDGGFVDVLNHHYENSSFHSQGDDYGNTRYIYSLWMTTIFEKLGVDHRVSEKQQYVAYQNIYRRRLDTGKLMTTGDKWSQGYTSAFNTTASDFLASNLYKDPYIKESFYINANYGEILNTVGTYEKITPVQHLILNDVMVDQKSIDTLPLSKYMGDEQGIMTARTSWDEDSMIVSMQAPERYFSGHQHLDAGNFEIYYKNPLVIDSGVYYNFTEPYAKNYTSRTVAHNSMLIYDPEETVFGKGSGNDGGQRVKDSASSRTYEAYTTKNTIGEVLARGYGNNINEPEYTYLKGDITNAYSEGKLDEFTRSFMFLNFKEEGVPGALIVFDKVTAKNPSFKKSWLLHTINEPIFDDGTITSYETIDCSCCDKNGIKYISDNTTNIIASKNDTYVHNKTLLPENPVISKLEGNWAGTTLYTEKIHGTPEDDESTGWRIEVSPNGKNQTDYFLNVISVADMGYEAYDSTLYESNNYVGVKIKDKVCFMSKEKNRTSNEFSITFSDNTDNEFDIIVADLAEGDWLIKDEAGNIVGSAYASKNSGTISFEGKSGTYKISKNSNLFVSSMHVYTSNWGITNLISTELLNADDNYIVAYAIASNDNRYETTYGMKIEKDGKSKTVIVDSGSVLGGKYGVLFYGSGIKPGEYIITPFAVYKDDIEEITVYGEGISTTIK